MKNVLWYIGFLSFLSLLYFKDHDTGFLLFLSFLLFFFTYLAKKDERIDINIGRATRNAFLYTMGSSAVAILYITLVGNVALYQWAFAGVITGTLGISVLSFLYYDLSGK
jgi:asparagine N-glycosylation enzyme membrane subunit Stt3